MKKNKKFLNKEIFTHFEVFKNGELITEQNYAEEGSKYLPWYRTIQSANFLANWHKADKVTIQKGNFFKTIYYK